VFKTILVMMSLSGLVCFPASVPALLHASPGHLSPQANGRPPESSDSPPLTPEQQSVVDAEIPKEFQVVLDGADSIEVVAIEPCFESLDDQPNMQHQGKLLGCTILRTLSALDTADKRRIRASFYYGVAVAGDPSRCWEPHHGLRVRKGASVLDIAICFTCGLCKGQLGSSEFSAPISSVPEAMFDRLLSGAREP